MNYEMLINQKRGLDKNYVPKNLVKVKIKTGGNKLIYLEKKTYKYIKKLLKEMNKYFETEIVIDSGYRTFFYQENLLKELIKEKQEEAYKSLAIPSHSEHQTGLAVDIGFYKNGQYDAKFKIEDYEKEFKYLECHAHRYGFILRYPKNKEDITGYIYEPWHLRFIGKKAKHLYKYNLTLEEYHNLLLNLEK